jgi:hypothetical protein
MLQRVDLAFRPFYSRKMERQVGKKRETAPGLAPGRISLLSSVFRNVFLVVESL